MRAVTNRSRILSMAPAGGVCAEVGVASGTFSAIMVKIIKPSVLYMVDVWESIPDGDRASFRSEGGQYSHLIATLKKNRRAIKNGVARPLVGKSTDMAQIVDDESLDLVYIDANHSYEGCLSDLRAWYPKVKIGGIVSGHDMNRKEYGVTEAVDAFFTEMGIAKDMLNVTLEDYPSFWFRK